MSLCCSSGARQKQQELDEDFRQCLVLYNYAAKHELNSRRREAFIWYLRANSELELLKVKALLVCTREFKENLEKLMSTLKQRLPTCMGHCMDEVVDVLERLRQICKDGDSPSYEMRLFDVNAFQKCFLLINLLLSSGDFNFQSLLLLLFDFVVIVLI